MAETINSISISKIRSEHEIAALITGLLIAFIFLSVLENFSGYFLFILYVLVALLLVIGYQGEILGNSLQVNTQNFPQLKKIMERQAKVAGIPEPNLFIKQSPEVNAFCLGFSHPYTIVVFSSIIENFNTSEIENIIAHELGHAYFGHPRISSMLSAFENMTLGGLFFPIQIGFRYYQRQAERTCDRFAVSITKNPRSGVTSQIKLAAGPKLITQVDEEALLNQSLEIQKNQKYRIGEWLIDHPYSIYRIANIIRFSKENGMQYQKDEYIHCINCGNKIKLPAKYCDNCSWVIEPF